MIFFVDPVCLDRPDGRSWEDEDIAGIPYTNQADLLNALLSEPASTTRARIPVAVTLWKSDLVAELDPLVAVVFRVQGLASSS